MPNNIVRSARNSPYKPDRPAMISPITDQTLSGRVLKAVSPSIA